MNEVVELMSLTFASGYPWAAGRLQLVRLDEVQQGYFLCPAQWETAYRAGDRRTEPWAVAVRRPTTLRVLQPGSPTWRAETRITVVSPDSMALYYVGAPSDLVRVVIPARQLPRNGGPR